MSYNRPLEIREIPRPKIEGPFDIVVRVAGAGVCRTDLHLQEGVWKDILRPELPFVLGHENVGYVEEVGGSVDWISPGDPVILHPAITCRVCRSCRIGDDMHCSRLRFPGLDGTDGGFAEYLRTSAFSAIKIPKGLDPAPMAPLADAGITAYHAVKKILRALRPGSLVALVGVGGLGHIAVQILRALSPAKILAIDVVEEKLRLARELGADYVAKPAEAVEEVMRITGGEGADAVLDFVGEHGTPDLGVRAVRRTGIYSVVGYGGELRIPTIELIAREISVVGNLVGSYSELAELVELYVQGKVRLTTTTHRLEDVNEVLESLGKGKILGRAVLVP